MTYLWSRFSLPLFVVGVVCLVGLGDLKQAHSANTDSAPRVPGNVYCCQDASGKRVCSEVVPRQCAGRTYYIYGKSGLLLRTVDPPISAEERERIAAEKTQERQRAQARMEERRQRIAILATYTSLSELDRIKAEQENPLKRDITEARARISETQKRLKASEETASRYAKDQVPAELASNIYNYNMEIKYQTELIKMKQQDLDTIQRKFEQDRKLYQEAMGP
jgi:hypothetical protein